MAFEQLNVTTRKEQPDYASLFSGNALQHCKSASWFRRIPLGPEGLLLVQNDFSFAKGIFSSWAKGQVCVRAIAHGETQLFLRQWVACAATVVGRAPHSLLFGFDLPLATAAFDQRMHRTGRHMVHPKAVVARFAPEQDQPSAIRLFPGERVSLQASTGLGDIDVARMELGAADFCQRVGGS